MGPREIRLFLVLCALLLAAGPSPQPAASSSAHRTRKRRISLGPMALLLLGRSVKGNRLGGAAGAKAHASTRALLRESPGDSLVEPPGKFPSWQRFPHDGETFPAKPPGR